MPHTTRPNFFTNQFLQAQDLLEEQAYHEGMRRRCNKTLYTTPGVVQGMIVTANAADDGVIIHPGVAIDGTGCEIVLNEQLDCRLGVLATASAVLTLTIKNKEINGDIDPTTHQPLRFTIAPEPKFSPVSVPPDETDVILAKVTLNPSGKIVASKIDSTARTKAGLPLSRLNATIIERDSRDPLPRLKENREEVLKQPRSKGSVFCLADVYPTTAGGALQWFLETSTTYEDGELQVLRELVVKNTTTTNLDIFYHYKILIFKDV